MALSGIKRSNTNVCGQAPGHIDRLLDEGEQVLAPPDVRVVEQRRADLIQDLLTSKNILYMYVLYVYYTCMQMYYEKY